MNLLSGYLLKMTERSKRLIFPQLWIIVLFIGLSVFGLLSVFFNQREHTWIAYIVYAISVYTLIIVGIKIPHLYITIKIRLYQNQHIKRYITDKQYRGEITIYMGFIFNLIYVVFRMTTAYVYQSVWFLSIGFYYLVLSLVRFHLLRKVRQTLKNIDQLNTYKMTGYLIVLINIAMFGMIIQMITNQKSYTYPGYIIYVSALYTFYLFINSIINIITYRKINSPILSASKLLNLTGAIMSVYTLQTAMLSQFGTNQEQFRNMMNTVTGISVIILTFMIALSMIIISHQRIYKERRII